MLFEIIQVLPEFSMAGGIEAVAFQLGQAWQKDEVPNRVIAANAAPEKTTPVEFIVPWLRKIPTRGTFRHLGRLIVIPIFEIAATFAIWKNRDAVILSHGNSFAGDVLVVHSVHAASLDAKKRSNRWAWRLNPIHLWVGLRDHFMLTGRRYRRYIAVSNATARDLGKYHNIPKELISVIPNGVDLQKFSPARTKPHDIRVEFGLPADARLLLFVGHEFARKGLAFAIAALAHLNNDVHLLVVGADDPAPYVKNNPHLGKRLVFAGERRDMPTFYAAADALVLPTDYETFSLVCMEAMAAGVPVFATRAGGIEDYLKDGINGYAIERDAVDIATKIKSVLNDDAHLARLRDGARKTAEDYSWDSVSSRYTQLLMEVWKEKHEAAPA
jgi:UDP-glucose:(heptosyl)LPS alpha-1,3-glucosyltransferase